MDNSNEPSGYIETPRNIPGYEPDEGYDAAYAAADALVKEIPELVRNDAERDVLEFALRDLIHDIVTGAINMDTLGIPNEKWRYNPDGSCA